MIRILLAALILGALAFLISSCGGSGTDEEVSADHVEDEHMEDEKMDDHDEDEAMHEEGEEEHMDEHEDMAHAHVAPPDEFADLTNPFADDSVAAASGKEIFETNCVLCHGPEGAGDGLGAVGLDPPPADLGDSMMMADLSDGYLFWRVSKGGGMEPFNSAMIAWEGTLTEEQRWQVISYVRTFSEQ